jgi:hypothetical protein
MLFAEPGAKGSKPASCMSTLQCSEASICVKIEHKFFSNWQVYSQKQPSKKIYLSICLWVSLTGTLVDDQIVINSDQFWPMTIILDTCILVLLRTEISIFAFEYKTTFCRPQSVCLAGTCTKMQTIVDLILISSSLQINSCRESKKNK